jgi:Ca2+-binding RTX toxin-like protein
MSAGAASLAGNTLNNFLYAGQGSNVIAGDDGIDTVSFYYGVTGTTGVTASLVTGQATGSGLDTLTSIERLYGSNNADKFTGDTKANYLYGYAGNDTLDGGTGIDTMVGGEGRDSLTGGLGNDIFDFNFLSEMGLVTDSNTWDVITDFSTGDRIDLSSLDANTSNAVGSNDAFSSSLVSTFTAAGQLKFENVAHVLYGNTDSNLATFEFAIKLTGVNALATADLVL